MTKEQFLIKWPYLNPTRDTINPYFIDDLNAVIAYEIEKAKGQDKPAPNPIRVAYDNFKPIRKKDWLEDAWIKKHSEGQWVDENGKIYTNRHVILSMNEHPDSWEIYTEAEAEQVTEPAKPKFDQDRFEAMFRAVVASGRTDNEFIETEEILTQLDAYYASQKGGSND